MARKKIIITGKELNYLARGRGKLPFHVQSPSFTVIIISTILWVFISVSIIWISRGKPSSRHITYSVLMVQESNFVMPQQEYSPPIKKEKLLSENKHIKETEKTSPSKILLTPNPAIKNNFITKPTLSTVPVLRNHISQKKSISKQKKHKQATLPQLQSTSAITAEKNNLQSNYWNTVFSAVSKRIYYPSGAKRHDIEGYATIQLEIDANGKIINITKKKSSGRLFYTAVIQAAKRATPFPPPPPELSSPLKIEILVSFRLH